MRFLTGLILSFFIFQNASASDPNLLGSREGDSASIIENVSTIHGDYTEVEIDLTVPAPDSLILSRFYSSRDTFEIAQFGGWRFNPHCFLSLQKDPKGKSYIAGEKKFERTFVYVGNPEGSILTYVGWHSSNNTSEKVLFKIDPEEECAGICNTAKGSISSWTNHKNNELYFDPVTDSLELHLCTKGKRFYQKNSSLNIYLLTHEILPSGNKIFYEFDKEGHLTYVKETNASEEKVLAWIRIQYRDGVHVETSDGKVADYHFDQDPSGARILTHVHRSCKPPVQYQYKIIDNRALLIKKALPEGRTVQIEYNPDTSSYYKVRSVTIPVNESEASYLLFSYVDLFTQVEGPGDRKSIYRFDEDFRLSHIEEYLEGSLYRVYKKDWGIGADSGNLISTYLEASNGDIYHYKHFVWGVTNFQ